MWILWSLLAVIGIQAAVVSTRMFPEVSLFGMTKGGILYALITLIVTAPTISRAFATGPSFAVVQFTQAGLLDIGGLLIAIFVFKNEVLITQQYIGIAFIILGMFLTIKF